MKNTDQREESWKEVNNKTSKLVRETHAQELLVKRIRDNCEDVLRYDSIGGHLLSLDAMGIHLSDPVYQKLFKNSTPDTYYIHEALARIGNRTMTEEEYHLLEDVSEENLVDHSLDKRLKDLKQKIGKKRASNGGAYWAQGPFHTRGLRTENDSFNRWVHK